MIRIAKLRKSYPLAEGSLTVLHDLDLTIDDGEFVAIMGTSGSGKSTLLNILGILDDYDAGTYHLADTLVKNLDEVEAARTRNRFVGFVFQSFHLLPYKTARENVALPLFYAGVPRTERLERADALLDRVGLADRRDHRPNQLSGGQKQRVAIARSLVTRPQVVLADEPTGALDSGTSDEIMELLLDVNDREGSTVVVVTHESEVAARASRTIRLHDGRVVADA
ncbi:MAG: ABC transporter ATP-binding protein [Myxococcota bacterium]